ncbi:MAG TPA: aldehyde dehydrogenase family protein [Solirubrobacteraceae bacterium]|nr:aldehyde dehydrogenase family protein [Solirubrobacteraceae bacterium]
MTPRGIEMALRLTYTSGGIDSAAHVEFERCLAQARADTPAPWPHLIDGVLRHEGDVFERSDPSRIDSVASRAHAADAEVVGQAVEAARAARAGWRRTPYRERIALLARVAREIAARNVEIAAVMSLETGKSRIEALSEAQEAVELIATYSREMERNDGFIALPLHGVSPEEHCSETLKPYGVFGVISPFNFPFALTLGMSVAALVCGNCVVVKPSEEAPWTAALLAEAMLAAELPAGVFNLVHGGPDSGRALAESAVDGIAFTGSAEVGRAITTRLTEGPYARPALTEMSGKNPTIVTASADLARAAEGIGRAAFGLSGQKCSACSRAIVHETVHDELVAQICAFAVTLKLGDPADRESFLGPVINERAQFRFRQSVAQAVRDGRVACGGDVGSERGWFVQPTVVADLPRGHELLRGELFLPFIAVTRVADLDEALAEANSTEYGLTAAIFSEDRREIDRFLDEIEAGVVYVNRRAGATTGAWPGAQSFCGWKSSGSTGKGGMGPYYLQQFMREQSHTVVS